jgi:hypothetical protein
LVVPRSIPKILPISLVFLPQRLRKVNHFSREWTRRRLLTNCFFYAMIHGNAGIAQ